MQPRYAQEDHTHAVVSATEDGVAPSGGASGEFLNDTPDWSVASPGDWGDLWDVVTEHFDSTRGSWVSGTGGEIHYSSYTARSALPNYASPPIQTVTGNPLERRPRVLLTGDTTSASNRTGDIYGQQCKWSFHVPFGARFIFGPEAVASDCRLWVGFSTVSGLRPTMAADISGGTSSGCIGIAKDSGDTNWHWTHSATTSVTKVDTGIPVTDGDLLCLDMVASSGPEQVDMRLRTLGGSSDESYVADTNIPNSITSGTGGSPLTMTYALRVYHTAGSGQSDLAVNSFRINWFYSAPW